ncbi:MAG: HAD family phosphatase [Erysipelotrichaceae bacterium]|nr:HAD family phosphatase [Erysipelotrichaceae bacterium]
MYRLLATDLDGTLLRSDKTISPETVEVLIRLSSKGVYFVPCTGRTHRELPEVVRNLPFLDYAITTNGGGIYDYHQEKYICSFTIDNADVLKVLEYADSMPVYQSMVVEGIRMIQADKKGEIPEFVISHAAKGIVEKAVACPDLKQYLRDTGAKAQKILFYPPDGDTGTAIMEQLRIDFPDLAITRSGPLFAEVNAKGIDKGKTLHILCEHLGLDISETIAFGDAENDMALLDAAAYAVVTANGTDETKKHADMICDSCDDDGVRKALEVLIK